jgi:hypothetical protein
VLFPGFIDGCSDIALNLSPMLLIDYEETGNLLCEAGPPFLSIRGPSVHHDRASRLTGPRRRRTTQTGLPAEG